MTRLGRTSNSSLLSATVGRYRRRIEANWQKATGSVIEVAKACAEANKVLGTLQKRALIGQLPFGESVFSKLAAIGGDKRLHTQRMLKNLPPNYSIIYEITQLDNKQLNGAIHKNIITPGVSRAEIVTIRKGGVPRRNTQGDDKMAFFAEILLPRSISCERLTQIAMYLAKLEETEGAVIVRPTDLPKYCQLVERYERALARYQSAVLQSMRKTLKREISSLKTQIRHGKKTTGFLRDELDLDVPVIELHERVYKVLTMLGRESDFDTLRQEAERAANSKALSAISRELEGTFPFLGASDGNAAAIEAIRSAKQKQWRNFGGLKV